jgi:hypothetical protein
MSYHDIRFLYHQIIEMWTERHAARIFSILQNKSNKTKTKPLKYICSLKWTIVSIPDRYSNGSYLSSTTNLYLNTNETKMSSLASQE